MTIIAAYRDDDSNTYLSADTYGFDGSIKTACGSKIVKISDTMILGIAGSYRIRDFLQEKSERIADEERRSLRNALILIRNDYRALMKEENGNKEGIVSGVILGITRGSLFQMQSDGSIFENVGLDRENTALSAIGAGYEIAYGAMWTLNNCLPYHQGPTGDQIVSNAVKAACAISIYCKDPDIVYSIKHD